VRRACGLPIQHCAMTAGLFEMGMGTLVLARGVSGDHLYCGVFLLDTFCLGIKDAFFRAFPIEALEQLNSGVPLLAVEPSYARKLLRDLAAWSRSLGFSPGGDFSAVEGLFGDVSAQECDVSFHFGTHSGPVYLPGPSDSFRQMRERLADLLSRAA
jgi:hypothetical protein